MAVATVCCAQSWGDSEDVGQSCSEREGSREITPVECSRLMLLNKKTFLNLTQTECSQVKFVTGLKSLFLTVTSLVAIETVERRQQCASTCIHTLKSFSFFNKKYTFFYNKYTHLCVFLPVGSVAPMAQVNGLT